jgi:hypothetical protein
MAARTGNKMRLYCFVLMLLGRKINESSNVAELILEEHGAPYTPGRFPEWRRNKIS